MFSLKRNRKNKYFFYSEHSVSNKIGNHYMPYLPNWEFIANYAVNPHQQCRDSHMMPQHDLVVCVNDSVCHKHLSLVIPAISTGLPTIAGGSRKRTYKTDYSCRPRMNQRMYQYTFHLCAYKARIILC